METRNEGTLDLSLQRAPVTRLRCRSLPAIIALALGLGFQAAAAPLPLQAESRVRNVVFILSDDHRYDFMAFHPNAPAFLETPHMDRMAAGGGHIANAFVTTALCSPSRATILTGQYAHRHGVVDNQRPVPEGTVFSAVAARGARLVEERGFLRILLGVELPPYPDHFRVENRPAQVHLLPRGLGYG